jgi:hypothetical protein
MFLFRVKVEELTARSLSLLRFNLHRGEETLRTRCPIREMSVVTGEHETKGELDIYLALDDFVDSNGLSRLYSDLRAMIDTDLRADAACDPRVSTELIHI